MPPPRSQWKGFLRVSLVSCSVKLWPATSEGERVRFNQLNGKTGTRVKQMLVDPTTGQEVQRSDIVRGYEYEKGRYVTITDEDIEKADALVESSRIIDLSGFVDDATVDPLYLDSPYWVAPDGKVASETYRVILEAIRSEGKAGIGKLTISSRERSVLLRPHGRGMVVTTLRPAKEVRAEDDYFDEVGDTPLDPEMVSMARMIIRQKAAGFDPTSFSDRYQDALRGIIDAKVAGLPAPESQPAAPTGTVVNLFEALKRSLAEEGGAPAAKPSAPSRKRAAEPAAEKPAAEAPKKRTRKAG